MHCEILWECFWFVQVKELLCLLLLPSFGSPIYLINTIDSSWRSIFVSCKKILSNLGYLRFKNTYLLLSRIASHFLTIDASFSNLASSFARFANTSSCWNADLGIRQSWESATLFSNTILNYDFYLKISEILNIRNRFTSLYSFALKPFAMGNNSIGISFSYAVFELNISKINIALVMSVKLKS